MTKAKQSPATRPGDASPYEEDVLRALRRIIRAVDLYSRELMARQGLSGPQLLCLRQLQKAPVSSGELARRVSLSPATITGIIDRLEARGLVTRERQAHDKRRVLVNVTTAGRRLLRQAPPPLQESFVYKLRALPENEQAKIAATLERLVAMMAAEEIDAAPLLATGDAIGAAQASSDAFLDKV